MNSKAIIPFLILIVATFAALPAASQDVEQPVVAQKLPSPQKAFLRSLVLPGWGHSYAQGSWRGMATVYTGADIGLWLGLINANWRRDNLIQDYETLAVTRAGADIEGKDRTFYLNLATYQSSDEYLSAQLRNRAWDRVDYVSDPAFHWAWSTEQDFFDFRDMRDDAETLGRRRSVFIALLVANRLLAGISSIGVTNKARMPVEMSFSAPPRYEKYPVFNATVRF